MTVLGICKETEAETWVEEEEDERRVGREGEVKEEDSFPETLFKVSALARGNHQLLKYNHH